MKKLFFCIMVIVCAGSVNAQLAEGALCNTDKSGFGNSLGEISFRTSQTYKINNQEWSDVVIAENCQKETFNGGIDSLSIFNADCRKNTDGFGDLFSWCAITRFERHICPRGWRVPTVNDFILLEEHFGGQGDRRTVDAETLVKYDVWGTTYGGFCDADGTLQEQGFGAYYWTISENRAGRGHRFNLFTDGYISPQGWGSKTLGHKLRCIRNI
jgi:uncharacterized protein (TIGR02145 family)